MYRVPLKRRNSIGLITLSSEMTDQENEVECAKGLSLVAEFFKDEEKTALWLCMPNPFLGGMSPREMIHAGRFKKLLNFIQITLDENQR